MIRHDLFVQVPSGKISILDLKREKNIYTHIYFMKGLYLSICYAQAALMQVLLYCITRISLLFPKETNILMKDAHNIINLVHFDLETNVLQERSSGERLLSVQNMVEKALSVSLVILVLVIINCSSDSSSLLSCWVYK